MRPLSHASLRRALRALVFGLVCTPALAWAGARELLLAGRLAEAIPEAEREARLAPADIAAQERWIDALLNVGRPGPALQAYGERVHDHPDDPDAHYLLARAQPDPDRSQLGYERALKLDTNHARSWMGLGAIYRARGQMTDARDAYERALRLDGSLAEAWTGLVFADLGLGARDAALAAARTATERVPHDADGWLTLSALDPAAADEALAQAVRNAPEDPRTHAALAEHRLGLGDARGALTAAEAALGIDPTHPGATLTRAFGRAITRGTLDVDGYRAHVAARALEATDRPAALAAWTDVCERWPANALGRLGRARVQPDASAALGDLEAAWKLDPEEPEVMSTWGLALLEQGRVAEALPPLSAIAERRPWDANLAHARLRALAAVRGAAAARDAADDAATAFPSHVLLQLERAKIRSEAGDRQGAYDALAATVAQWPEPRLVLGLAAAARDVGRAGEAADLLDRLARQTGQTAFADIANQLRAQVDRR